MAIPPFPSPPSPSSPAPRTKSSPRRSPPRPVPSNLRYGGTGLPGFSPSSAARTPPGASPTFHRLHGRFTTGTPPATAAAQPSPGPLSAGQGGPPVPGGHQPGPPRRGRQWEALLPGRGCRYRGERRVDGGTPSPTPSASLSSSLTPAPGEGGGREGAILPLPSVSAGTPSSDPPPASPQASYCRHASPRLHRGGRCRDMSPSERLGIPRRVRGSRPVLPYVGQPGLCRDRAREREERGRRGGGRDAAPLPRRRGPARALLYPGRRIGGSRRGWSPLPGTENGPGPSEEAGKERRAAASRTRALPGRTSGSNRAHGRARAAPPPPAPPLRGCTAPGSPGLQGSPVPPVRGCGTHRSPVHIAPQCPRLPGAPGRRPPGLRTPLQARAGRDAFPGAFPHRFTHPHTPPEQHPPLPRTFPPGRDRRGGGGGSDRGSPGSLHPSGAPRSHGPFIPPSFGFNIRRKRQRRGCNGNQVGPGKATPLPAGGNR